MGTISVGGIDPSSKKIAIVETRKTGQKKAFIHTALLTHDSIETNLHEAFDFTFDFVMGVRERDGQPPRLFIEAPVMGVGGPGATIPQAYVSGSIMAAAHQGGAKITLVNNSTWKKRVLGNGNTPKEQIAPWVELNWPEFFKRVPLLNVKQHPKIPKGSPDQDILDAGCINLFGWKWVDLFENIRKRRGNA